MHDLTHIFELQISQFLTALNWAGVYEYKIQVNEDLDHIIVAYVNMDTWEINLEIHPKVLAFLEHYVQLQDLATYLESPLSLTHYPGKAEDLNHHYPYNFYPILYEILSELVFHEIGHSRDCPIDKHKFADIIQAVSTQLEQAHQFSEKKLTYLTNQFTDIIVNSLNGIDSARVFYRNGFFLYYSIELQLPGPTDPSFLYFLLINFTLFGYSPQNQNYIDQIISSQLTSDYSEKLEALVSVFCPFPKLKDKLLHKVPLTEDEQWKLINYLSMSEFWPEMAYDYTSLILEHLPKELHKEQQKIPDFNFTLQFKENDEFRTEIMTEIILNKLDQKPGQQGATGTTDPQNTDANDTATGSPTSSPTAVKGQSSDSSEQPEYISPSDGHARYPGYGDLKYGHAFFANTKFLKSLYQARLKRLQIKNLAEQEHQNLPFLPLTRTIMDERDNPFDFDPLMSFFLPQSDNMLLFKKGHYLHHPIHGVQHGEGFNDLVFFIDDSASMDWYPLEGTGKYDDLIIAIYSILEWLRDQKFASVIRYNFNMFSSTTRSTGWMDYFHLDRLDKVLFNKESGTTRLSIKILSEVLSDPRRKTVIIITDGEISNSKEIIKKLTQFRKTMLFTLIQIGRKSEFAGLLHKHGFAVNHIRNIKNLRTFTLDFLDRVYNP